MWLRRASSVTPEGCYDFYEEAIRLQNLIVKACPFKHLAEQYIIYVSVYIVCVYILYMHAHTYADSLFSLTLTLAHTKTPMI